MSKILVNEIGTWTGTEIALVSGRFLTGTASQFKITGGTAGQALITDGSGGLTFGNAGSSLPTQSGQAGKYLQTDGTDATWAAVDALPSQTGQAGEYLKTDGTTATWEPAGGGYDVASTSTGYFDLPAGTTAQRPGSPATGNVRVNTETNSLEHYYDGGWVGFAGVNPTVGSIVPTTAAETGTTITVNGTNFYSGATIQLIGTNSAVLTPGSVSWISATQMTFTTPALLVANEPYDVKVTNPSGATTTLNDALDAGGTPTWTTAAGNLGTIQMSEPGPHATIVATDPDGTAITYTETTSVLTGAGITLGASTGVLTGDPTDVGSVTTYNFDVDASDGANASNRSFNITVVTAYDGSSEALAGTMDQLEATSYANLAEGAYGDRWIKYSGIFGGNAFQTTCVRHDNKLFALAAVFRKDPELDPFTGKKAWRWFYGPGSGSLTGTSTYDTGNYFTTDGTNAPVQNPNTYIGWTDRNAEGWDIKTPMWDVPTNNMRALARGNDLGLPGTWNNRCIQTWTTWAQNKSLAEIYADHGLFGDPGHSQGHGARQIGSPAWSGDTGYMDCFYIGCTDTENHTTTSADFAMWYFGGAGNEAALSSGTWPTGGFGGGVMRSIWDLSTGYPQDAWQASSGSTLAANTCMTFMRQPSSIGGGQVCGTGPVSWWVRGNQV